MGAAGRAGDRPGAARRLSYWLPPALVWTVIGCTALAALSAAVLPTVPSYDPWSWVVWGREVFDPHLSFAVSGGPSWKPLPVCFTAIYGLFGGAAPTLWVITARAGGLLGLVAAYRLAAGLARRPSLGGTDPDATAAGGRDWLVPAAGVLAVLALVLTQDWAYYMYRGTSEPILIAAALWAVDRHAAGRRGSAFVLLVAASLIRPEAWPFLFLYGVWLWLREPQLRVLVLLGWAAVPFLWFVPPWVGSGQPFLAASHAKDYNGHLGSSPFLTAIRRGADLQVLPILVAGLVATALGFRHGRDRLVLGLAAAAAAWWVIVVAMTLDGYPGLERFWLPAAALTCALGGAGFVAVARLGGAWVAGRAGGARGRVALALAAALCAVFVAASVPAVSLRASVAWAQESIAARAVTRLDQLSQAVAALGGHHGVLPCRSSFAAVNHGVQTALAWQLHVTLGRVGTSMRHQGLDFVGPHDSIDGGPAALAHSLTQRQLILRHAVWRVYRVTAPGADTRCVGG